MVMFQGRRFSRLCALNPDSPATNTAFVANSRFVPASLPVVPRSNVVSLVRRNNTNKRSIEKQVDTSATEEIAAHYEARC